MNIWLLDTEAFVKLNGLAEVTNPLMFDKGNVPTVDGLFSTEIFGVSTRERRENWAYIDLGQYFIAPKVYISLTRLNRNFESVIYSSKKFSIKDGLLVPDENGGTGLKWLYDNWEKIKFPKNDSNARSQRIDLLEKNKKELIFWKKLPVIPAFYRDVDLQSMDGNPKVHEINDLYSKIIRNVNMVKEANDMDFMIASITGQIQSLLVDVYNTLKDKVEKKNGYIRRFLMGKSVDYASRIVITATPYVAEKPSEQYVDFEHTGVPLSHVCSEFTPFMLFWLNRWFKQNIENFQNNFPIINDKGEMVNVKLDNPESFFNAEYLETKLAQFVKNPYTRFDTIPLPISKEEMARAGIKKAPLYHFTGFKMLGGVTTPKDENKIERPMTWTDLLYMAAVEMTADKHVVVTRYPITDYNGSYISRIHVISTRETMPMMVNGTIYPSYPVVKMDVKPEDMDSIFRDTVNICALYLPAMGADHDGDQITCKGVFSQEANEECERIMKEKTQLLNIQGGALRTVGNEGAQTLYSMTRFTD